MGERSRWRAPLGKDRPLRCPFPSRGTADRGKNSASSVEAIMAAEAVSTRIAPPSPTRFLRTPSLGTLRLNPAALLASRRQTVSLFCIPSGLVTAFDTSIKRSRRLARTSAEVRSPVIYNCRIKRTNLTFNAQADREDLLQDAPGSVAIQFVLHYASPVDPNRSALMRAGSCCSSCSSLYHALRESLSGHAVQDEPLCVEAKAHDFLW